MAALIRCGILGLRHCNLGSRVSCACLSKGALNPQASFFQRFMTVVSPSVDAAVVEVHRRLDFNQSISNDNFNSFYSKLKESGAITEQEASLLLYICSVGPFDVPAKQRIQYVEEIWEQLDAFGIAPSSKLCNMRLKAFVANKKEFDPLEELTLLKSLGVNPDKVTYGLLIEGFCQKGDVEGAEHILEAMKEARLLLGIKVFNSFITGHFKAGSPAEAENIVEVLKSRGLSPDAETYYKFASHFAEEGDIASVLKYLNEADEQGILLEYTMLLDVYRMMVIAGHSDKAHELLSYISEKGVFRSFTMQKSCQLVSEGYPSEAMELYKLMPKIEDPRVLTNTGSILLKAMITSGQDAESIVETAESIMEVNPGAFPLRNALLYAYKSDRTELAVEILELMISKGHTIKAPEFLPAVCSLRDKANKEGLFKVVNMLMDLDWNSCRDDLVEHTLRCCYPALTQLGSTRDDIIANMKAHEKRWESIFFIFDLMEHGPDAALQNVSGKKLDVDVFRWYSFGGLLNKWLPQEWSSCVKILEFLSLLPRLDRGILLSKTEAVIKKLVMNGEQDVLGNALDIMKEKKLQVRQRFLQAKLLGNASSENLQKIKDLASDEEKFSAGRFLSSGELENLPLEELEQYQAQHPERFMPWLVLLNKAMARNNLEEVKERLSQIEATNFTLSLVQLLKVISSLIELGDLELATSYFEKLKASTGTNYKSSIPLQLGVLHLQKGNLQGALDMIEEACHSTFILDERANVQRRFAIISLIENAPTLDAAESLHRVLLEKGTVVPEKESMMVHVHYMRKILDGAGDEELMSRLQRIYKDHRVFPCLDQVLARFIQKQDVENLKECIDLGISVFGNSYLHHRLASSFIMCKMPAKATTVLQTPGLKISQGYLIANCKYFIKNKDIESLKSMVDVVKPFPVSRGHMLKQLCIGYVAIDEMQKAVDVLEVYNEEFIEPEKSTIDFLVSSLRSRNMSIPDILQSFMTAPPMGKLDDEIAGAKEASELSSDSSSSSSSDSDEEPSSTEREPKINQDEEMISTVESSTNVIPKNTEKST